MVATQSVSPEALAEIEEGFRSAWTGARSTPFIVDAPITTAQREQAEEIARRLSLAILFRRCPTLAVWAVLTPLAQNYGATTNDVYLHIARFVRQSFEGVAERDSLKRDYRIAARGIGLPVSGNDPTDLFFTPLGPPRSRHRDLAKAFVATALHLGPPAIEDTPSARSWQRRAVIDRCQGITRLHATIDFDRSAHCARRFEAWRKGAEPLNDTEADLFDAYDRAARMFGRSKADLTGPPQIIWMGDRLALEAERSTHPQKIKSGPFPVQIRSGTAHVLNAPWPSTLSWSCGATTRDIPLGPDEDHVLVFDADSGALLARPEIGSGQVEVAASRIVVLGRQEFSSPSFGPALPAADPAYRVAWIEAGEPVSFDAGGHLRITTPRETAIWIDGTPIARSGSRALIGGDGSLRIQLDPEIGGRTRIVRARLGAAVKYCPIELPQDGAARIPFSSFGFDYRAAPGKAVFEVLAPGAAGNFEARAELSVATWLWPGFARPKGPLLEIPCPGNYNASRSEGLRAQGDRLCVDLSAKVEAPILALDIDGGPHQFQLRTGAEVLHHHRMTSQDKVVVPRGGRIFLGHAGRHDTLILQSSDRDADFLVLGKELRRPFFARSRVEITAELLEGGSGRDDRIALRRKDGRVEIFARIIRRDDPQDIEVIEDAANISLSFLPQERCDALRISIAGLDEVIEEGDYAFGRHLAPLPPLRGVRAEQDIETGRILVSVDRALHPRPARATFRIRTADRQAFTPVQDGAGIPLALGLGAPLLDPDQRALGALAKMAAAPVAAALAEQNSRTIEHAYRKAMEISGVPRLVGAVRPALAATLASGETPRHDLVGTAPWIFEASPHAYGGLPEASGLAALGRIRDIGRAKNIPDPEGESPLGTWLARLGSDDDLPDGLKAQTLSSALSALRFRLKESELGLLISDDPQGMTCACLCDTWIEDIEALRDFDAGGADARPARIACTIERFARACALGRAAAHLDDLSFRTGLPKAEVGACLTLMLRAGVEIFTYFRALWTQAADIKRETA